MKIKPFSPFHPSCCLTFAVIFFAVCILLGSPFTSPAFAVDTLRGYVAEDKVKDDKVFGQVLDGDTGLPLPGVQVSMPDQGFSTTTGTDGQYEISRGFGTNGDIMSVQKPGYEPFSVTVKKNGPPVLTVRLNKQHHTLVLDSQFHHLGDGSFSQKSDHATEFKKPAEGPGLRIPFSTGDTNISQAPFLKIGSIVGLDTLIAHFISKNEFAAHATPLIIKLNNTVIAQMQTNGDNQRVMIPKQLIHKGENVLEFEAGYQFPEPGRIDYDDFEFINLVLYL